MLMDSQMWFQVNKSTKSQYSLTNLLAAILLQHVANNNAAARLMRKIFQVS